MRAFLYYTAFGEEVVLPLPASRPGQEVSQLEISHTPLAFFEEGVPQVRLRVRPGERVRLAFHLRTYPLEGGSFGELEALPPEDWAPFLLERGHRLEVASGFLLTGRPHTWLLVDGRPLDPLLFRLARERPEALLPLGAPDPRTYLGGHEGKRLLLDLRPWPEEAFSWDRIALSDPLPLLRGVGFLGLGLTALGVGTGPWPYLPYLGLLAFRQGRPWLGLWRRRPLAALEALLFHAFALSLTFRPSPELGLAYLGLFLYNRLRGGTSYP